MFVLRPARIDILLSFYIGIALKALWDFALFDRLIVFATIALPGDIHKTGPTI